MSFPKGFLWGGDISANQCEGGWDEGGKSPNMTDYHTGGTVNSPTDFYHHYKEDIAMFAELGFKAFNMTLSLARIFPKGIKEGINPEGVEFYHNVFKECLKYGIEPLVHLYKYDMPAFYIEELGGWKNRFLIEEFVEFGKASIDEFQEVTYWSTFNEINAAQFSILDSNNQESSEVFA